MWWLDPGKEVLNILFNRVLAPYVENLDLNQVNYGIGQGQLTLRKLRLKRGALDKFRLPVDVIDGHLGKFTLSLHWMNLGNEPVEVLIEDVYLLVVPSSESAYDPEEEEKRAQASKVERLQNAELLHLRGDEVSPDSQQSQGLIASLTAKIINNLQVTVKNIHIRYEDKLSVPGHPFSAGITLAGFTAVSVNEDWMPAFIDSTAGAIHKLANLESLAVYFDTDAESLAGLPTAEFVEKFTASISRENSLPDHQFILKPVTGEGRIIMNHKSNKEIPQFDVQLLFNEIGVLLDDNQYRDVISLVDMYHFYARQYQYQKYRPSEADLRKNKQRAMLLFAGNAILDEIREHRRKWTWAYFAERRDDRHRYVELFKKKQLNPLLGPDLTTFESLEKKLSYEDIRFYRSIARSQLRKDLASRKKLEEERGKQQAQTSSSWTGWLWGSSTTQQSNSDESAFTGEMTEEQRKQLYEVLDYDEKTALTESFQTPRDALKARVVATLKKGSFALKTDPHGKATEIISIMFEEFQATYLQRPDNFEVSMALGGFAIHDGTTANTRYPMIVHVQDNMNEIAVDGTLQYTQSQGALSDPFFALTYENNPLDERADHALTVRMRYMEIVYHKGYVEAIYAFFKPPSSQLESVEALLDVASQTLEGLRKETRAGLEYALQTHKTVDVQMDLNAPIIIVPEDITTNNCRHLVIDAGHISIESELANKKALQEINAKRKQEYTDADYKQLESMMYDRLSVKLQSAQFVIGNDLQSCRTALTSKEHDSLHLLERINVDLQVQNSIVPSAYNLAKFKVSGHLPTLQVNLSDTNYKSLMRLIDVTIPNFDNDSTESSLVRPLKQVSAFKMPSGFFGSTEVEYTVDDDDIDDNDGSHGTPFVHDGDAFFEAGQGESEIPDLHQHIFELDFLVDTLRASLYKSNTNGSERELGDVSFERFALGFAMEKFVMTVDVKLSSLSMSVVQPGKEALEFISSASINTADDLLLVKYTRVQPISPEFMNVYEGITQSVDAKVTTFIFRAAPEPVISLYEFIMTTFVPEGNKSAVTPSALPGTPEIEEPPRNTQTNSEEKMRVLVNLASVQILLINEDIPLATLSLSTANVSIVLHANTMRVETRLGSLAFSDDSPLRTTSPDFKQILSIEGDNFANLRYETSDPNITTSIGSSVYFNAGSLKLHYLEAPLHDIYLFLAKLAKLKGLYDAAAAAAVQSAPSIDRMKFTISIKSPIVVFPSDPQASTDVLVLRLGELSAGNLYENAANKITASLRGIQLASIMHDEGDCSTLNIIDDIDITTDIIQPSEIDRSIELDRPDTEVVVKISDIKLHLTQIQYGLLLRLSQSVPRVLAGSSEGISDAVEISPSSSHSKDDQSSGEITPSVDLQPELRISADGHAVWTTVDVSVEVEAVKLHLYDDHASTLANRKDHGIARFALNGTSLKAKLLSDGASETQIILKSFTMSSTRPGNSKFREIIPAAQHDRNQVMILYTSSGQSSQAVVTVDSPEVIFTVDPLFSLLEFTHVPATESSQIMDVSEPQSEPTESIPQVSSMDFRLNLHDVSITVLEDDTDLNSQAIRLCIKQILLSQQGILALSIERLGMSLTNMEKGFESVRFMDDVDMKCTLDTRISSAQQMTSIDISTKPIVFRASYRDINLITAIANKAIALYSNQSLPEQVQNADANANDELALSRPRTNRTTSNRVSTRTRSQPIGHAKALVSREQFKGSFEGFRLVLIGDLHEQPMLHLRVKPFILGAKDWSGELQATSTLAVHTSYWNLSNSHWEPLIDPWTFTVSVSKPSVSSSMIVSLSARERLNLNISTTFIELAIATSNMLGKEGENVARSARGSYAPYRVRNRTGATICIWSDVDGNVDTKDAEPTKLINGTTIDWRFDDWKTMREHVSSTGHNSLGLQFLGKPWEQLRSITVDREGEYIFSLRPRTEKYAHRLLCEVKVQDNVKIVTFRSTYRVENQTLYPLEITLVDEAGQPVQSLEKIAPGQDYALPIEAVNRNRIRLQPDQGFGYKWSPPIRWEDLIAKRAFTIRCPHADPNEAAFRFQAWVETDLNDTNARKHPKINLKLRAPIELENLLPYNVEYRIFDKDANQNWKSYLRKGGIMPVHSVELRHLILLNISVQDTAFKPSEFAIISTDDNSDFDIEKQLTLKDTKDRRLDLKLHYHRYPDSGGAFKVQIYSPYIVVNKTGLPFSVRPRWNRMGSQQDVAGDTRPEVLSHPIPFMLSTGSQGKDFSFKIDESTWSPIVSMDAPTAETRLIIPSQARKSDEIHVGLSWTEGVGKYKLTKVITLTPRFILKNNLFEVISFREHGVAPRGRSTVQPGERCPLHFMRVGEEKLLVLAFPGLNAHWSTPINLEDIGTVHVRLRTAGENPVMHLVRVDVKIDGSTIFVFFSSVDDWPFMIENDSDYSFTFYQSDDNNSDAEPSAKTNPHYTVSKHSHIDYAWDYPASRNKRIMLLVNGIRRAVDIMEIGDLMPFKFSGSRTVSLDVRAEAHKQVLRITNYNPEFSLYRPRRRNTVSIARQDSISSSQDAFEAIQEEVTPTLSFNVDIEGIGVSLINRRTIEVVYLSINTLKFEYTDSPVSQSVTLSCGSLQVDNQLHDALFPVVLQPTPISKESSGVASLPTVQGSVIWLKDQEHGVFFVKYCSILLQALTLEADEDFLFAIYDLTKIKGASWNDGQEDILIMHPDDIPEPQETASGEDMYFEVLELQPIMLSISFMRTERVSGEDKLNIQNPFAVVVNAITMAVGNVNDAPLEMNALAIKDMRLTLPDLQDRIMYHYRQEVLRQLYRILGSADFIGNPVGLFTNVSSGVADIFYEPFNGVVMHGNRELGIGIAKGAASFVKKTVFGFSDSFTKFTSSVGKGLSAATLDAEYQQRRRMTQRRNKPRHAIYGVTAGAEALANSLTSGLEGVVMKPIEGAENGGAMGFFKGVGKGLIGAVTKPVVGVFDLASNLGEGIRNTTTVFDNPARDRVRLPRHIPMDGVLVPYSEREALGQYWMKDLDQGAYRREQYVAHITLPGGDNVVLLTGSRVLSFWSNKLRLEWELPFTQVQGVTIEDTGVRFAHKAGKEHDKFVFIPDKSSQSWFFGQVALVVKAFNARRRMDS